MPTSEAPVLYGEIEPSFVGTSEISHVIEGFRKGGFLIADVVAEFIAEEPRITLSLRAVHMPFNDT